MKNKKLIIIIVSILMVFLLATIGVFVGIPMYLNYSARKTLCEVSNLKGKENIGSIADDEKIDNEEVEKNNKDMFNQKFLIYETSDNTQISSEEVLALISVIAESNSIEDNNRLVNVNGTIITNENYEKIKKVITNDEQYKVKCIYDDDGYVNTIELKYIKN